MRERLSQYINEVVSLVIMLLLTAALIAGQAASGPVTASAVEVDGESPRPVEASANRRW